MTKNDGGPAFANMAAKSCGPVEPRCEGMSLRDWFAAEALAIVIKGKGDATWDTYALWAYQLADAMIAERAK